MKTAHRKARRQQTYSLMHVMLASPEKPMPEYKIRHQLTAMYAGLNAMEQGQQPTTHDWRVCSDAVNLMETLIVQGTVIDADGLLMDAITAMAKAGKRHVAGGQIRLDGPGITAMRSILADYATVIETLSERVMVQCHRDTEKRLQQIMRGQRQPHDVEIVSV